MEDLPILLISLIVYLVAASSGGKKKKRQSKPQRRRSPMREAAQGEQNEGTSVARSAQTQRGFAEAFSQDRAELQEKLQEGEDPCHPVTAQAPAPEAPVPSKAAIEAPHEEGAEPNLLAQDMLRGVIMSEILTRPQQRAAMRRNRQGYHG